MGRKCTLCGRNGHNYRTCSEKSKTIKLFGVKISTSSSAICKKDNGRKIKKGIAWTEDEQRLFLKGLEIHGKGKWAKISKDLLPSRTPTQIASHAQKYFMRLEYASNDRKSRKKPSVFDVHLQKTQESMNLEEISEETIVSEHDIKIVPLENQDQETANSQVVTPIATSQSIPNYYNVLPITWVHHMYDYPAFYASGIDSVASTSASGTMDQRLSGVSSHWSQSSKDNLDLTLA
ncbi:probable transcription factor At5g61620 [Nicotiana sylvestris]|uniref:Transcription factor MYB1R1-like n=2 Tax=Nicotiana TaxID=4085 RepID=A0A1S3ZBR5_TOBAC|nr:PREDICTED: transcription factor MYB1R1-like [Nicotiana sylvestris]XP_016461851.1 PREDICTED: transcription factor MYB1R1-like [Nicotiana tabacum]